MIVLNRFLTIKSTEYIPQFRSGANKQYIAKCFTSSITVKDVFLNKFSAINYASNINPFKVTL